MTVSETSREAYQSERAEGKIGKTQRNVLEVLSRLRGPATGREIEDAAVRLNSPAPGAWKRLSELERAGRIRRAGTRPCRITRKRATVWDLA